MDLEPLGWYISHKMFHEQFLAFSENKILSTKAYHLFEKTEPFIGALFTTAIPKFLFFSWKNEWVILEEEKGFFSYLNICSADKGIKSIVTNKPYYVSESWKKIKT